MAGIDPEFFETYPLFRPYEFWETKQDCVKNVLPRIRMACPRCDLLQTFKVRNIFNEGYDQFRSAEGKSQFMTTAESVLKIDFLCSGCEMFFYRFVVYFRSKDKSIQKVGQYPPWSIDISPDFRNALGEYEERYKHGLICESQGYGIGAFGYYRRIVEGIIDKLLDSITELIPQGEGEAYTAALHKAKESKVTQKKIELVKDLLPTSLRPERMNPLAILHQALSEGLHSLDDEECLGLAEQIRRSLEFLVNRIEVTKSSEKEFLANMRKLSDKKMARQD